MEEVTAEDGEGWAAVPYRAFGTPVRDVSVAYRSHMVEGVLTSPLVVGRRSSLRSTLLIAAMTALLLPGLGVVILPAMLLGEEFQWGGLAWVSFWAMPAFIVRALQREHRLDGTDLVSTYRNRVVKHPLSEVVSVRAAPLFLPAARLRLGDASVVWVYGPPTESFVSAVLLRAPFAENRLPSGNWLRPRRAVWFVFDVLGNAS